MKIIVMLLAFLCACVTQDRSSSYEEEDESFAARLVEVCGYPKGCYCQPVGDGSLGLIVTRDGQARLGPVMCYPDETDLRRDHDACLPVEDWSEGIRVIQGRVVLNQDFGGHTHNIQQASSALVRCDLAP